MCIYFRIISSTKHQYKQSLLLRIFTMMSTSNDAKKWAQQCVCCNTSSMPVLCQLLSAKTSENQMQDKAMCLCITVYYTRVTHRTVPSVSSKLKNFTMSNTEDLKPLSTWIEVFFKQLAANYLKLILNGFQDLQANFLHWKEINNNELISCVPLEPQYWLLATNSVRV